MGFDYSYPPKLVYYTVRDFLRKNQTRRELKKRYRNQYRKLRRKNPRTVYLLLTPEHENIGDHAIALAETELLRSQGIDYVEITGNEVEVLQRYGLLSLVNGCPVLLQGGGYLGTLWPDSELLVRELIAANPKSPIVFLPNTIFYDPTPEGKAFFEESVEIYGKHPNLYLYAREETSYDVMRQTYRNVKLMPDMVFSMNRSGIKTERRGCILSLRQDCERTRTPEQESLIRQQAGELFGENVHNSDMVAQVWIPVSQREQALEEKFAEFSGAELVITDRLHGMIFCAITGTPCIVLDSKSPKVRGCYQWVRDLPYIRFVDTPEEITQAYHEIPKQAFSYDNASLMPYYQELAEDLEQIFRWRGRA